MTPRPLSEREHEVLCFLLTAPALPDGDVLRHQAAVAVSSGSDCPCGCASIGLVVDPSAAPKARPDLPGNLVEASTVDIAGVHEREPLSFFGDDDLVGAIGLILWVEGGWLSGIEIWGAGNFANPRTFPPAELFEAPRVTASR
jgi:hypothetical protein